MLKCDNKSLDINECASNNGRGPCDHFCVNTFGRYQCKCRAGFTVRGDTCIGTEINPILNTHFLPKNTLDSFLVVQKYIALNVWLFQFFSNKMPKPVTSK